MLYQFVFQRVLVNFSVAVTKKTSTGRKQLGATGRVYFILQVTEHRGRKTRQGLKEGT